MHISSLFQCSPKYITTAPSSKRACNKELALLVEVAAVSPLPTRSRSSWGPQLGLVAESYKCNGTPFKDNQRLIRVVVV